MNIATQLNSTQLNSTWQREQQLTQFVGHDVINKTRLTWLYAVQLGQLSWVQLSSVELSCVAINTPLRSLKVRGVHENGSSHRNGIPMGFPRKWELDLNKDGNCNGNVNTTTWQWERLMLVGSQNHFHGLVKSHYTTRWGVLCLRLSHKGPYSVIYFCLL